jgi:HemY protein
MNLFRNLLFWIALALLGALVAQLLVNDQGYVLVRYGGYDYEMTLVSAVLVTLGVMLGLWLVWKVLSLPFVAVRRHRQRRARAHLTQGLLDLEHGHWTRAEKSLALAAQQQDVAALASLAATRAAWQRGETDAARAHADSLAAAHPATHAIALAELALAEGRPEAALAALDAPAAQPLPPRGLALRAQVLVALGRAGEAYGLLGALRQQQALPPARLQEFEAQWAQAGLLEAADANVLADRWEALPKPLRSDPAAVAAYARRAAALRWDEAAARSIEQALDAHWDDGLAALYGALPIGRFPERGEHAQRWLQAHPDSPGLSLSLARLAQAQSQWPQAESFLHRAIAQGAGAPAWEELGHGYARVGDETRARLSYLNALRATRGEPLEALPGRDLRQRIADEAAIEERDEHGMPRLRG